MPRNFVHLRFFETYYYSNIISNIIEDPFPYIRGIHSWYEDNEEAVFLPVFPKRSRLHGFAAHIIHSLIDEEVCDTEIDTVLQDQNHQVWVDRALRYHGFPCDGFRNWCLQNGVSSDVLSEDHLAEYHQDLWLAGELETLVEHLSNEVFHVLFSNRKLLSQFNEFMARALDLSFSEIPPGELGKGLAAPGVLKRANLPQWVKRAVFFRDRGLCSMCQKDLSNLICAQPEAQYDHIIPLAMGGLNDVTNIQLLCASCNGSKSNDVVPVSSIYESWY
jgi:hypothetical protein